MSEEENFVEITDENGDVTKCEVYDIVEFEGKTYALLLPEDSDTEDDDGELIVLEYIEENENDAYFQNIENEDEFNRVCEYIESLEYEDENSDEE